MPTSDYLFVYGTLQKESQNNMSKYLAEHAELVSRGYIQGKLYKISWFPGVVESENPSDRVYGSLFKISDITNIFKALDDYEGIDYTSTDPDLYKRMIVSVFLPGTSEIKAWVYFYNQSVANCERIVSGDFLE